MPHLVGVEGLAAGTMFLLSIPIVTLARNDESDIALMDRAVSLHHARLVVGDTGQVRVESMDSASLVLVNDVAMLQAVLVPGDLLQIGDSVFRFEA